MAAASSAARSALLARRRPAAAERERLEPRRLHGLLAEVDAALVAGLAHVHTDQLPRPRPDLGVEFLTAARRFLVQAAMGDPDVLRTRANVASTAAAVALVVGRGNGLVGRRTPVRASELLRAFGVRTAPSQRVRRLQEAAMLPRAPEGEMLTLGSPELLVASARSAILAEYEELTAAAAEG